MSVICLAPRVRGLSSAEHWEVRATQRSVGTGASKGGASSAGSGPGWLRAPGAPPVRPRFTCQFRSVRTTFAARPEGRRLHGTSVPHSRKEWHCPQPFQALGTGCLGDRIRSSPAHGFHPWGREPSLPRKGSDSTRVVHAPPTETQGDVARVAHRRLCPRSSLCGGRPAPGHR